MDRIASRPGTASALLLVAAVIFYIGTGSVTGAAICLMAEISFWAFARRLKRRTVKA